MLPFCSNPSVVSMSPLWSHAHVFCSFTILSTLSRTAICFVATFIPVSLVTCQEHASFKVLAHVVLKGARMTPLASNKRISPAGHGQDSFFLLSRAQIQGRAFSYLSGWESCFRDSDACLSLARFALGARNGIKDAGTRCAPTLMKLVLCLCVIFVMPTI